MSNEITTSTHGNSLTINGMGEAFELAKAMASAKMVPQCLQGSPGDCLMVIEQAMRWRMSPFAVAQATSVVKGKLCFEGKLVSAAIQSSGVLDGRLNYEFTGDGKERTVICSGTIRGEKKPRTVEVTLEDASTENVWWSKTPDQMLAYHSSRVWARRHAPEVMLGVYSPEEFDTPSNHNRQRSDDVIDVEEDPRHQKQVTHENDKEEKEKNAKNLADELINRVQASKTLPQLENLIGSPNYNKYLSEVRKVLPKWASTVEDNVEVVRTRLQNTDHQNDAMQEMPE
ncbi:recombinase RecT [Bombella apis]|uniref:recombinase RecT n=1 Tax=Bombella apis TaxID=1785988 RepID=UPI0012B8E708|nr:recombinase RecT [Bombella apis]MPW00424.1 hypothetical protein [Bombella apis]